MEWMRHALLVVLAGSKAYGTNTETSDTDYRGIMPATRKMLVGLDSWDTQYEQKAPFDVVLYTLPKFVKLALSANPNILDALFSTDDVVVKTSETAQQLRSMAQKFLSKRVYTTFTGYANAQLKKLRSPEGRQSSGAHGEWVKAHGYDTKNAMHLVRLYRMGYEALTEGIVQVRRPDAEELLSIKNGAWTLEACVAFAKDMEQKCKVALRNTNLPDEPDAAAVIEWLMSTQQRMLIHPESRDVSTKQNRT